MRRKDTKISTCANEKELFFLFNNQAFVILLKTTNL